MESTELNSKRLRAVIKHRVLFPTLNAKMILLLRYKNKICMLFLRMDKKP